jgi:hypothetical protein
VPKNDANACVLALAYVAAPDGCSGYGGVTSDPPTPPIGSGLAGSRGEVGNPAENSGVPVGSDTVVGLPSSARRIAVTRRQKL